MAFVEKPGPLIISASHMHLLECNLFIFFPIREFSCHMERVGFVSQHIHALDATEKNIISKNANDYFLEGPLILFCM